MSQEQDFNPQLFNLIMLFSQTGWFQLGKIANPMDGKITKDLKAAQFTIDTLLMLRDKMKGNLTKKEEEALSQTISNLQINYADEAAKPAPVASPEQSPKIDPPKTEDLTKENNPK